MYTQTEAPKRYEVKLEVESENLPGGVAGYTHSGGAFYWNVGPQLLHWMRKKPKVKSQ